MDVRAVDRWPQVSGDGAAPGSKTDARSDEVLLVLADGSVWGAWLPRSDAAVAGPVRTLNGLVVVGGDAAVTVCPTDFVSLVRHLRPTPDAPRDIRGCVTARGATSPLHAAVALAVARGEIGRPW
jgi:hypothetical protein